MAGELLTLGRPLIMEPLEQRRLLSADWPFEADMFRDVADELVIAPSETLSGNLTIVGDVVNRGVLSPGNSPGIIDIEGDLTIDGTTQIEIGGTDPGQPDDGYDQIRVTGDVFFEPNSKLDIDLIDGFQPEENQIFDILTYGGNLSGAFDTASGLYGFGDGSLYFEVVDDGDGIVQLKVKEAPGGGSLLSRTPLINDLLGQYYSDYFTFDASVAISGELAISDFVTLAGSFEIGVNLLQDVTVATGLPANLAEPIRTAIHAELTASHPGLSLSADLQTLSGVPVTTLEIGGSDIRAFAGTNGPYWTDLDGDGNVGWAFNTGDGDDASRTITSGSVTIGDTTYGLGIAEDPVLPFSTLVTLQEADGVLAFGNEGDGTDVQYGDINGDGFVDADETAELSENATGLAITDVDFGYVAMMALPDLPLSSRFFHALEVTASQVGLVGIEQVELSAQNVLVEVNTGPTWTTTGAFGDGPAVVDFATSFPAGYEVGTGNAPVYLDYDGNERIGASVDNALLSIGDNDGKFVYLNGNLSFEKGPTSNVTIATGLSTNLDGVTKLAVQAQFVLRTLLGNNATLSDDLQTIDDVQVSALQIGGSDIQVFVGTNGPYWTDLDGDGNVGWAFETGDTEVSRTITSITGATNTTYTVDQMLDPNMLVTLVAEDGVLAFGNENDGTDVQYGDLNNDGFVDADETAELSENATGLAITDVDFGFVAMTPTLKLPLLASQTFSGFKLTASQVGLVGIEQIELSAQNVLVEVNTGPTWMAMGVTGDGPAVVDFASSFPAEGGDPAGYRVRTGTTSTPLYIDFDGNERLGASVDNALLAIGDDDGKFVYLSGNLSFEKGPTSNVTIGTGIASKIPQLWKEAIRAEFALRTLLGSNATLSSDLQTIEDVQVSAMQIGGSNLQAFVGLDGPYWTDLDQDGNVSWAFNTGDGNEASRTITSGSVTIGDTTYGLGIEETAVLPANTLVTLEEADGVLVFGNEADDTDVQYGDLDNDGIVDADETVELNEQATGLAITDVDFGFVAMTPTLKLPMLKSQTFTALKLNATQVGLVGIDEVQLEANDVSVNVNLGPKWTGTASGMGPAVIKYATSFPAEDSDPAGYPVRIGTTSEPVYIDFDGKRLGASIGQATLKISEFVHITGSIAFEQGPARTVGVTGGLLGPLGDEAGALLAELGLPPDFMESFPVLGGGETQLGFMTIGASNVHAFVGMDGPYWTDLDGDRNIGWTFHTGDGGDPSRTITSITGASNATYTVGQVLDPDTVVTLSAADGVLTLGSEAAGTDVQYGDINGDGKVDADETGELNEEAVGLVINDFDFGMAIMTPKSRLDFAKYFALKASADKISLVGIEGMTVDAEDILVEVNLSTPSVYGLPLFPVVDFAGTEAFASEQLVLFDTDGNGTITLGELEALNSTLSPGFTALANVIPGDTTLVDHEMLLGILNTDDIGESRGVIDINEAAALLGGDATAVSLVEAADEDGDGKIDPLGCEINTGGDPVYLSMDSPVIRAQGFLELDVFGSLILSGSIAFELGPTQDVTLNDDDQTTKTVTTLTIGAANVTAFVGYGGPYWTDLDGDHSVSWTDADGNPQPQNDLDGDTIVDADETAELDEDAIGLHITDLDLGLMVMACTDPIDLGVYVAAKASVDSFGFVGVDQVEAEGTFDIALNLGIGTSGLAVVDFPASFGEEGFPVNTGDPTSPVLLDFEQFFVSFQLGGIVTIYTDDQKQDPVFRLNGLALLEAGETGLSLFVAAGLEFGPDMDSGEKLFDMNALGGLVINGEGIAADIDVSVALGGALSDSMSLGASLDARVVFNSTGNDQSITIPAKYVRFLEGTVDLSDSYIGSELAAQGGGDVTAMESLTGTLDNRFKVHDGEDDYEDGSATFTIFGTPPTLAALFPDADLPGGNEVLSEDGPYFAVAIEGELTISDNWGLSGCFGLIIVDSGFQMVVDASLELGSIGTLGATGVLIVDPDGVRARVTVDGELGSEDIGLTLTAHGLFELNTTGQNWSVDGTVVYAHSLGVAVDASFDFLGFATGHGAVSVSYADNNFQLVIDGELELGSVLDVDVHAYVGIFGDGVIVDASVDLDLNLFGFLDVDVEGRLRINTTDADMATYRGATIGPDGSLTFGDITFKDADGNDKPIAANTFFLDVKGDMKLLKVLTISGHVLFEVADNDWRIDIPNASADLSGIVQIAASGWLSSSGEFDLNLEGNVNLGVAGCGFYGYLEIHTTLDVAADPDFTFSVEGGGDAKVGGVSLAGANIKLDASGDLGQSIPITATVEGTGTVFQVVSGFRSFFRWIVSGKWVTKPMGFSVPLGTIRLPGEIASEPVYTPPLLAEVQDDTLVLNVGDRASLRNVDPSTENEQYTISRLDSGTIRIAAFGETEDYEGVSNIIGHFGPGNDAANLNVGGVYAEIRGGSGNDTLHYGGSGQATLYGDEGDDHLTIGNEALGGTVPETPLDSSILYGGADNDTLTNASAADIALYGEQGNDTITGGTGDDSILDGGAGNDWIRGRGGRDDMFGGPGVDRLVVEINDLELFETVDGGDDEDQIAILGNSSAQDLRVTMDNNVVKISSYSGASETGSVTLANLEAVVLSGGEGADNFSVVGELDSGGVTDVVIDMGGVISESGQDADGAVDTVNLTLSNRGSDEFTLSPADTGVRGIWRDSANDHFSFSVLSGSEEDEVHVSANESYDLNVLFDEDLYGAVPANSGPNFPHIEIEAYLTDENGQYGPTYQLLQVQYVTIAQEDFVPPEENLPFEVDSKLDERDGNISQGNLSIREAIELANLTSGPDTILFAEALAEETIALELGELTITDDLTITGLGADQLTISGNHASRIFNVDNAAPTTINVSITGLSLVEGSAPIYPYGGGIYNQESLSVESCTLANNSAVYGGGIRNDGTLTLTDSTLEYNLANYGGGIYSTGTLTVTNSAFGNNTAEWGGGIYSRAKATLTNSTLAKNSAARGGGVYNSGHGTLSLTHSTLAHNSADSSIDEMEGDMYLGGGVYNDGTATVTDSTIENNSAVYGGGIANVSGTLTVMNSTIAHNSATGEGFLGGGGITNYYGTVDITNSTLNYNTAKHAGGISNYNGGTATVTNCTLAYNSAHYTGGGIVNVGIATTITNSTLAFNSANYAGGVYNDFGTLTVTNSTIAYNSANGIGGIMNYNTLAIANSLVGGNTASYGRSDISNQGTIAAAHNVIESGTGNGIVDGENGNQVGIDPLLDPDGLRDNGGPTQTIALLVGSPAIDAGDNALAVDPDGIPLTTDQRGEGFARSFIDDVDIGAFEFQFIVSTLIDENDGIYDYGDLSLREALYLANSNPDKNVIRFAPDLAGETINLTLGELQITSDVDLVGSGVTIDGGGQRRVFRVTGAVTDATLRDLTITNGFANGNHGGGIYNEGILTLEDLTISGNRADGSGGGIYSIAGELHVVNSTIDGNTADYNNNGNAYGAGIFGRGKLWVVDSTISRNTSRFHTGGIHVDSLGDATVVNSTISSNSADGIGGISNYGTLLVLNSTIADNRADINNNGDQGGGVYTASGGLTTLHNTIVAGNTRRTSLIPNDLDGSVVQESSSYNLVGDAGTSGGLSVDKNNILGVDPLLEPLGDYGGTTQTHALAPGSPAIDAGDNGLAVDSNDVALEFGQRCVPFVRIYDDNVDIGAYEVQTLSLAVDTPEDESDGDFAAGDLSLREAIELTNANPGDDTITFAADLTGETIELSLGQLTITSNLNLLGPGVTIQAADNSRVLQVDPGVTDATISGLTISGGSGVHSGGGILNEGTLSLLNSTISGNSANYGGGIRNNHTLTVTNSTISGNSADGGGAIYNGMMRTLSVANSTISGNSSVYTGGGISNDGTLSVTNSTISGNSAGTAGGGVQTESLLDGSTTLHNTIVAGNVRGTAAVADDLSGDDVQAGSSYNLIGHAGSSGGLTDGDDGNIVGVEDLSWLASLGDYSGPTQTHALLPGSPAIDAGDPLFDPNEFDPPLGADQRGLLRIGDGDGDDVARIDIGAYESVYRPPHPGDADLSGATDLSDFNIWNANKFMQGTVWTTGDFNDDGVTDLSDFNIWNAHKFTTAATPVPVPPDVGGQEFHGPTEAIDELARLRELEQSRSKRSSDASTLAAEAVDRLLATYW